MADFTIVRGRVHRIRDGYVFEGVAKWPTTATTATLPIKGAVKVRNVFANIGSTAGSAANADTSSRALSASISATSDFTFRMNRAGTFTAASFDTSASIASSDSTYWTFGLLNKTATTTVVDSTAAANSTKATGGSATTAFTSFALTLAAGVTFSANDLFQLNVTKTSTPAALTGFSLTLPYSYSGTSDERVWTPTADTTSGFYLLSSGKLTFTRTATTVTSNLLMGFRVEYQ